jgi:hypothetical protein
LAIRASLLSSLHPRFIRLASPYNIKQGKTKPMRTVLSIAALAMLSACFSSREVQVEMKSAELIRIDTIYRFDRQEQLLTWKSPDNMYFTSYVAMGPRFIVGSRVTVFVQK